jgi:hypothetical protein
MRASDRLEERCSPWALWQCATAAQRCGMVAAGIVLVVLAELSVLEPRLLPVTAIAALVAGTAGMRLRQDLYRQRRLAVEAEQGIRQLERWLGSGEHA